MTSIQLTHNRLLDGKIHCSTYAYQCQKSGETIQDAFERIAAAEIAADAEYAECEDESTPSYERHICHQNVVIFTNGKYHA